jgi:O-antigen/teichoic acid export membrane protein
VRFFLGVVHYNLSLGVSCNRTTLRTNLHHWRHFFLGEAGKKGIIAVIDQSVYSATNFLVGLLMARMLPKEDFGTYAIFYSIATFLIGIQGSFLSGPMMVLGASKSPAEGSPYFSSLLQMQAVCAMVLAFLTFLVFQFFYRQNVDQLLLLLFCLTFLSMSIQEFIRRLLMTRLQAASVLINDALLGFLLIGSLSSALFFWSSDAIPLSLKLIVMCVLFSFISASILGLSQIKDVVSLRPELQLWKVHLNENWRFGKWLFGTSIGSAAFSQLNIMIVGALGGRQASANFEATRLIVAPVQVLLFAAGNYLTPVASRRYNEGGIPALRNLFMRIAPLWYGVFVIYAVVGTLLAPEVMTLFYGQKYVGYESVAVLWILVFFVLGLKQFPGMALIAMRRPDAAMGITLTIGCLTLILTVWLTIEGGETLAVLARLIGEFLLFIGFLWYTIKLSRSEVRERYSR